MTFASLQTILDEAGGNMEPSNRVITLKKLVEKIGGSGAII